MFVEFHTLDDKNLFVNFGAVIWVEDEENGSTLVFSSGKVLSIKETIVDIRRQFQLMAMQQMTTGRA